MYKNKKSGIIGIVISVIILILLVILTNTENSNLSYIENVANKLVNPIQNGLTYVKNRLHGNSSFFTNINNLQNENANLINKNNQLEETLRELETIKAENQTLKEYLKLTEKYTDYTTVVADVINRDISNYSKTIVINVGKNDGIKENMTVIIITHNTAIAPMADKVIYFKNGTAENIKINENPMPIENIEW